MKKILALLLSMSLVFSLIAGCSSSEGSSSDAGSGTSSSGSGNSGNSAGVGGGQEIVAPEVDKERTLSDNQNRYEKIVMALPADPESLDPSRTQIGSRQFVLGEIYETLFDYEASLATDDDMDAYVPYLADHYEIIDELHYNVILKDYIKDSAGNAITAEDVVASYKYNMDNGWANKFDIVASVTEVDEYTVQFEWTEPLNSIGVLEWPWCRILIADKELIEAGNLATEPVGTGPYVCTEYQTGVKIVLEANDNYWQTDENLVTQRHYRNVQTIQYDIIAETSQHVIALQTDAIDITMVAPAESLSDFMDGGSYADGYNVISAPAETTYVLIPNQYETSPCNDINMRLAIFYAIDQATIETACQGTVVATYGLGSKKMPDYGWIDWDSYDNYQNTYDPELAKEYLKKAGYNGEEIVLLVDNNTTYKDIATVVHAMLVNVGINAVLDIQDTTKTSALEVQPEGWHLRLGRCGGTYQIGAYNKYFNYKEKSTGLSVGNYKDETLQTLFETAYSLEGHTPENMTAFVDYVFENAYMMGLCNGSNNIVYSEDIAYVFQREGGDVMPGGCQYYLD